MAAVYVMHDPGGPVKVGYSRDPAGRLAAVRSASGRPACGYAIVPCPLEIAPVIEAEAHRILRPHRFHGEWFDVLPEVALNAIIKASYSCGLVREALPFPSDRNPPADGMNPRNIPMPDSLVAAVDKWRGARDGVPNRSEAVRRLLTWALEADGIPVAPAKGSAPDA